MQRYNPKDIEPKWQKIWQDQKIFHVSGSTDKPKKYIIDMFPYPSGAAMHVGHVRNFTISDVLSQYHRQKGYNVLHTMGWDTFGLPAENYAIKTGTPPAETTMANIANFRHQLQQLGMSYDWSREINTTDPGYYKWTQWIFTQLFKNGLAYQAENPQWWCPVDKTVLANEQVEAGKCWRCGSEVIKKSMKQWFFKITDYADQLLEGIDGLDWPEKIKTMQRNWIGKSMGAEIKFQVASNKSQAINVFTTRPDTLFGATFMVLAPEHPLVSGITTDEQKKAVQQYVKTAQSKSDIERQETDREKTGVFTGAYAINPVNNEKIPIWIADYVLMGYGTGAIMAVPAHDERDHEFARKFDLPIQGVIEPKFIADNGDSAVKHNQEFVKREAVCAVVHNPKDNTYLCIGWKTHLMNGLITGGVEPGEDPIKTARREVREETGYKNLRLMADPGIFIHSLFYHRQKQQNRWARFHYLFFDLEDEERDTVDEAETHLLEAVWKSKDELADFFTVIEGKYIVRLLDNPYVAYSGEGIVVNSGVYNDLSSNEAREKIVIDLAKKNLGKEKINYKMRDWLISRQRYWGAPIPIIHCTQHGAVAVPESDLPVILPEVKSYEPTGEGSVLEAATDWVNTTCPTCGKPAKRETDTMDGYACSSWYFLRYTDSHNEKQAWDPKKANYWLPIDYYCGGDHAVSHLLYSRFWMHFFADQGLIEKSRREPVGKLVYNGYILAHDGNKMSKSKGNVINPDDLISQGYGADSLRLFEMFIAPYDQNTNWNTNGVPGTFRFLNRFWTLVHEFLVAEKNNEKTDEDILRVVHKTIAQVSKDLEQLSFNTVVAALMEAVNTLYKIKAASGYKSGKSWRFALESVNQLLAPFAPHITEELWQQLGHKDSVHISQWPVHDEKYLVSDSMMIVVQVNGKLRANIELPAGSSEGDVTRAAEANEKIASYLSQPAKKVIYVPDKLINFVV